MNIKKIGLTALAGALVSVSANAAELSVTGGASLGFSGEEKTNKGNGWTMNDSIVFKGSAEMDNGFVVSTSFKIDESDQPGGGVMDNRALTIDMGDAGTLTFYGQSGSSNISLMDDTTPTAGEEAWDDVSGATAHAYGPTGDDTFFYQNSSLIDGVTIGLDYIPSDGQTQIESSMAATIKYTGIDGLTIGAGIGEDNGEGPADADDVTAFNVTYAMDAITVGFSSYEVDSNAASSDTTLTAMGISYAVSDDLSVSLNSAETEIEGSEDQEALGISASLTMGSMTLSANHNSVENVGGTDGKDRSGYALGLSFAF
ncbi:porin [Candidatus Pelagibacter sp.]|uniref:porin n=1 Tax=Candidatus Pelagibacter sp. TaxID=2024849 RepID=UPI003D139470